MKYLIVICLLFAIVNSKRDFSDKLEVAKSLIGSTVSKGITNVCQEVETKTQCLAVVNPIEKEQCCFSQMIYMGQVISEECDQFPKDINAYENITKTEQFKAFSNEVFAFEMYSEGMEPSKIDAKINCNNGELTIPMGDKEYSKDEQETFKNKNHCLKKNNQKNKITITM